MKKLLLTSGLLLLAAQAFSQIIVYGVSPAAIQGNYDFLNPTAWSQDLSDPANAVEDTLMVPGDSTACTTLTAGSLTGKIALIWRGGCEFGAKALAAQNAGARAVIIVNNVAAAGPAAMGAGAVGASVTIPVVSISLEDGQTLYDMMQTQDVVMYLGEKLGYFADDIGFTIADVLRAESNGMLSQINQNASEFTTVIGAWVRNFGQNDQTGITLNATVNNGAEVYNETSTSFNLLAGDSAFISLPDFSLPSYPNGTYTLTYSLNYGVTDDYAPDNTVATDFKINDTIFSYARLDANMKPITTIGTRPATNSNSYSSCIAFVDANASRLGVEGMYFSASINAPDSLDGQEVIATAFKWNDVFTDLNDPNFGFTDLEEVTSNSFYFIDNPTNIAQYVAFPAPFLMEDGQRYLFCVQTFDTDVFFGYDERSRYVLNMDQYLQPIYPIENDAQFLAGGFVSNAVPALAVKMYDASENSVNENLIETSSYPNPAKDLVTVKVNASGKAGLTITDLAGRTVAANEVTIANGQFTTSVEGFNAGTYVFSLNYADGTSSQFKVVVTK
jgi:hypothetical protein